MNVSVIVPTYNRPRALKLCLTSLAGQSMVPSEVLIADDGSSSETRDFVQEMQGSLHDIFPIKHVWQEDIGFRKPKILNQAVRQTTGEYLIFIDGDCMAHRHFIRAHVEHSDPAAILGGKRVEIGRALTEQLLKEGTVLNNFSPRLIMDSLRRQFTQGRGSDPDKKPASQADYAPRSNYRRWHLGLQFQPL